MAYLKIIRPQNLMLLLLVQLVIKYGFFEPLDVMVAMNSVNFILLTIATLCIAAAGNVINDLHDVDIDMVNKPSRVVIGKQISEKSGYTYYIILNVIGVGAGFIVANQLGKPGLAAIFIIISALLYSYASYLKSIFFVGNVLVSALVAMSLIVVILFDIYPVIDIKNNALQKDVSKIVGAYAASAFYINLIREIVKDIQDINGDKKGNRVTLPLVLGRSRTTTIVFVLGVIGLLSLLLYTYKNLYKLWLPAFYFVFLIGGPLLYFCIQAWSAHKNTTYRNMSVALKLTMLTGVCSLLFFAEILKNSSI